QWGRAGAKAADALSPSGNHLHDWDPHRVHVEPLVKKTRANNTLSWTLVASNPLAVKQTLTATLEGRGLMPDQTFELSIAGGGSVRQLFTTRLSDKLPPGRHIFIVRTQEGSDSFLGVDVTP